MTTPNTGVLMLLRDENYRFGIEEEFFVVDAETKLAVRSMPRDFARAVRTELGGQVTSELLQSQIEIATLPHTDAAEARAELRFLRRVVGEVAAEHGLAILAAGTHPTAMWTAQRQTESLRYDAVMHDLQMLGQRNQLCGLHVHCELPDPDERVDVMGRMLPYVPMLVALSTSSPFWQARRTGLMGYRLAAYDELPRTGLPELFRTRADFEAYVRTLVEARVIEDSSYVWWALRPSMRHPTLELRAPDCCTRVEDALAIASLYRALCRRLVRLPQLNADLSAVDRAIIAENKWRAQRYGIHGSFVDPGRGRAVQVADLIEQVVDEVACDAMELGVMPEVMHAREIAGTGTSADTQIAIFEEARGRTASERRALDAVKEWIAAATLQ